MKRKRGYTYENFVTPKTVLNILCEMIEQTETSKEKEKIILDLGAGEGALARAITEKFGWKAVCVENKKERHTKALKDPHPNITFLCEDYLSPTFSKQHENKYDLVVSNPDFVMSGKTIELALRTLNPDNENARLFFILPTIQFCASQLRIKERKAYDFKIVREVQMGLIVFYGKVPGFYPVSIFELRKGKLTEYTHQVENLAESFLDFKQNGRYPSLYPLC